MKNDKDFELTAFGFWQWVPRESSSAITDATYSCDSQSIYTSFEDGSVSVFTVAGLKLRCRINPTAYLPSTPRYAYLHLKNVPTSLRHCFPIRNGLFSAL